MVQDFLELQYPGWYSFEKETEGTIKKLVSIKDLKFYLTNPNEYIRRLAIIRINELKLQESLSLLEEVLVDPLESLANQELAAWTIKSISEKWRIDLFISHELINSFSGQEEYSDLFNISVEEPLSALNLISTDSLVNQEFEVETDYTERDQEIDIEIYFPWTPWSKIWVQGLIANTQKHLENLPRKLANTCSKFFKLFKAMCSKFLLKFKDKVKTSIVNSWTKYRYQTNPISVVKQILFYIIYIILFPIRICRRQKKLLIIVGIGAYFFLVFTPQGRLLTVEYLKADLVKLQNQFLVTGKEVLLVTWGELKQNLGVWQKQLASNQMWQAMRNFLVNKF